MSSNGKLPFVRTLLIALFAGTIPLLFTGCPPSYMIDGDMMKVDITPPRVEILAPLADEFPLTGTFVLRGSAYDDIDYRLKISVTYQTNQSQPATVQTWTTGWMSEERLWSLTIEAGVPGGIAEGRSTLTMTTTDKSGRKTRLNHEVVVSP